MDKATRIVAKDRIESIIKGINALEKVLVFLKQEKDTLMNKGTNKLCKRCGYTWNPHTDHPKKCPKCGSIYWNFEKIKLYSCQKCQHTWNSRRPSVIPTICPKCKTKNWQSHEM